MDFLPFGKRTKTGLLYPNKSRRQLALHCVFFHRTKLEASFRWIFCLSAKEPKRGPCTQTKAVGSWRCTASFYIEPSWKQASAGFFAFRQKNQNGALVPKQKPYAAGAALRLFT